MEVIQTATEFLSAQGGWGVTAFIGFFYWKKDREHGKERQEWMAFAIETTEVLSSLREVIRRCHKQGGDND